MNAYNIHLLNTVVHKFSGSQIGYGMEDSVFPEDVPIPKESTVGLSIRSTLFFSQSRFHLQTHFQVDDVRLAEHEGQLGYRLRFCLFAIFEVDESESKDRIEDFAQRQLPNILAPIASDNHARFVSTLQPDVNLAKLQPYIPPNVINSFIEQGKITFKVATNAMVDQIEATP